MKESDFLWSSDEDQFTFLQPARSGTISFTVASGTKSPSEDERARILMLGLKAFPKLLAKEPALRKSAYRQISSEIDADDWPTFEVFSQSMVLSELCLVDGHDGHIYYTGAAGFSGYVLTIYCDGIRFAEAELEEARDPREA